MKEGGLGGAFSQDFCKMKVYVGEKTKKKSRLLGGLCSNCRLYKFGVRKGAKCKMRHDKWEREGMKRVKERSF